MTGLQFRNCSPAFVLSATESGATVQINYPVKFLSKNFPAAESGVILNEVIIAHAAPKIGPVGDANRLPSEEKVVEEAALVLS